MNNLNRKHMYEKLTILSWETGEPEGIAWVLKKEYQSKWEQYLTAEEKIKYEAMPPIQRLQIAMSSNPFRALGAEY